MNIYININRNDMLLVEGEACTLCVISSSLARGYRECRVLNTEGNLETLQDNQYDNNGPSYAEQIASGNLVETTIEELELLGY